MSRNADSFLVVKKNFVHCAHACLDHSVIPNHVVSYEWPSGRVLYDVKALDIINEVGDLLSLKYSRLSTLPFSDHNDDFHNSYAALKH